MNKLKLNPLDQDVSGEDWKQCLESAAVPVLIDGIEGSLIVKCWEDTNTVGLKFWYGGQAYGQWINLGKPVKAGDFFQCIEALVIRCEQDIKILKDKA